MTFTALQRNSAASFWMEEGQVAENITVCRSALVCWAMALQQSRTHSQMQLWTSVASLACCAVALQQHIMQTQGQGLHE